MKYMKKNFGFILEIFAILLTLNFVSCKSNKSQKIDLPQNMTVGAVGDKKPIVETDSYIVSVINEGKNQFVQRTFTDKKKGISLEYSLFVPQNSNVDSLKKFPLIMFIPDASGASKSAKEIVEQYFGANIWVTSEEQKKHATFVLVPAFSVLATDDNWNTSAEIEVIPDLISSLKKEFNIDQNRIYTTGQSMGCMTSLYLNAKYPKLFAASFFVSGQWKIDALSPLKKAKFFYITAGGDEKASGGQTEVMQMLEKNKISYSFGTWSAKISSDEQDENAKKLLAEGNNANFIRFDQGSVLSDDKKMEHNASFNYGYKISAVRDWLFEQTK